MNKRIVFIAGAGSDIGKELALSYAAVPCNHVIGTYRKKETIKGILSNKNIELFKCDLLNKNDIDNVVKRLAHTRKKWDTFISCVGSMEPIGSFFESDFNKWEESIIVNSIGQLRLLHEIYPYRNKGKVFNVVFFAGGGINNPLRNYSAYCVSKILLIKACELLDDENKDLNVFIIGPGWVKTKILGQTLNNRKNAGEIYRRTLDFLKSEKSGTSHEDIYDCINWCVAQGKPVVGGRNISVVHDGWRNGGNKLKGRLLEDSNMFKLRRFKNTRKKE